MSGGIFPPDRVQVHRQGWTITIDTHGRGSNDGGVPTTRLRAPFISPDGLRFVITRESAFDELGKRFGMQDVRVGDPEFDTTFLVQGSDEDQIRALLANPRLRQLIAFNRPRRLESREMSEAENPSLPTPVRELYLEAGGAVKDLPRLHSLYALFLETLTQLHQIGSASDTDAGGV